MNICEYAVNCKIYDPYEPAKLCITLGGEGCSEALKIRREHSNQNPLLFNFWNSKIALDWKGQRTASPRQKQARFNWWLREISQERADQLLTKLKLETTHQ